MKKQLPILLLFFFNCLFAWSQDKMINTTIPCDNDLLKKTPGRWMRIGHGYNAAISKQQLQEIEKRLHPIHQWAVNIYPSPMAFDAQSDFSTADQSFASQFKIVHDRYGEHRSYVNGTPVIHFSFFVKFCAYFCANNKNQIFRGAGCESGTTIYVIANDMQPFFFNPTVLDKFYGEIMRIDDRPINQMPVLTGVKWKGYDLYHYQPGSGNYMVLLHRDGMLPYIPVTRKQYLDRIIACYERFYEGSIKAYDEPGLVSLMPKKEKEESIQKLQKQRDEMLKYCRDELEATTKAGLLESPAILTLGIAGVMTNYPIFTTMEKGGKMLVTENPAYFRKDLPKYVPQLIVYMMDNAEDGPDPAQNPYHFYYRDFPIEKLQAMIDK
jgi:hypothetical protein